MKSMKLKTIPLLLIVLLSACATVNTFNKSVVVANETIAGLAATASTLKLSGKITHAEALDVADKLRVARTGIEEARIVAKNDLTTAEGRLQAVLDALTRLDVYLQEKGV